MLNDFKNAFQRNNNAHIQLIIINIVVFLSLGILFVVAKISNTPGLFELVYDQFTMPSSLQDFAYRPWTLVTYSFAHLYDYPNNHIGIGHIFFNMLGFYWFARLFVEYLGSDKLIAVYVLSAITGGLTYFIMYNTVPYFMNGHAVLVGASAAVFGVMVAAATLLPDYSFYLLFFGPVKIKYIAAGYVLMSFLFVATENAGGNLAHLGGALMGFVYIKQLQSGNNIGHWITVVLSWIKNLFKPRQNVKVSYRNSDKSTSRSTAKSQKASQEEIDVILDKISDRGYESLTKEEKDKLFNASKK